MKNTQRSLREELSVEGYTALKKDGTTFPILYILMQLNKVVKW
jgi:hypothetical protein